MGPENLHFNKFPEKANVAGLRPYFERRALDCTLHEGWNFISPAPHWHMEALNCLQTQQVNE